MNRKVIAVSGYVVIPWIVFGILLGLLSGDWIFAFLAWPGANLMGALVFGTMFGVFKLMEWGFDD